METARSASAAAATVLALLLGALGCGGASSSEAPVETVRRFLEAMDRSAADVTGLEEAYSMLDAAAQKELQARAQRASSLTGTEYEPFRMLAQGRFLIRFMPVAPGGMRARVDGDNAVVVVQGQRPEQRAEIPLVREQGKWRIKLAIPAMDQ